jgi:hypothetical protein
LGSVVWEAIVNPWWGINEELEVVGVGRAQIEEWDVRVIKNDM